MVAQSTLYRQLPATPSHRLLLSGGAGEDTKNDGKKRYGKKRPQNHSFQHFVTQVIPKATQMEPILILVGDGLLISEIKNQVKKLKLEKKVIFTGFRNDPEKMIALADICVLNSVREGLPRVVMQYIAGGKPAITTNLPGIEEIIKDGMNGEVFDMHDPKVLYNKLSDLLSNNEKLIKLTNGAKETDVSNWSIESMGKKIEDLYSSALLSK